MHSYAFYYTIRTVYNIRMYTTKKHTYVATLYVIIGMFSYELTYMLHLV